jgi:hypothetical protein
VSSAVERPPHFAFAVAVACSFVTPLQPRGFPQKYFQKVKCFRPRLRAIEKPHPHHKSTTTSPQKTIQKTPVFPKPPQKTPANKAL